jgi:hypothetical protein
MDESCNGYLLIYADAGGTRDVSEDVVLTVLNISASLSVDVCICGVATSDGVEVPLEASRGRGRQQLHFPPERHRQGFSRASTVCTNQHGLMNGVEQDAPFRTLASTVSPPPWPRVNEWSASAASFMACTSLNPLGKTGAMAGVIAGRAFSTGVRAGSPDEGTAASKGDQRESRTGNRRKQL